MVSADVYSPASPPAIGLACGLRRSILYRQLLIVHQCNRFPRSLAIAVTKPALSYE